MVVKVELKAGDEIARQQTERERSEESLQARAPELTSGLPRGLWKR
jgi:hypothetical protein